MSLSSEGVTYAWLAGVSEEHYRQRQNGFGARMSNEMREASRFDEDELSYSIETSAGDDMFELYAQA